MNIYTKPASAGNTIGLPKLSRRSFPAVDERQRYRAETTLPSGLTEGGKAVYRLSPASVSVANMLAALAGLGTEVDHAR